MHRQVLAFPVLPGRTESQITHIAEQFKARPSEYRESRRSHGIHFERAYLQHTPMGDFVLAYTESEHPFSETGASMAKSDLAIDKEFVQHVHENHGVDLTSPPAGSAPETVGEWWDSDVTERHPGFALCMPLLPDVLEQGRAWSHEAYVTRADELAASRRSWQQSGEVVTVIGTPDGGAVCCVYLEGQDPISVNRHWSTSNAPFDVWFRENLATLAPPNINLAVPVQDVALIFDSQGLLIAR